MKQAAETLEIALRVLMAITDRHYPEPDDVAALERLAPWSGPMPLDELACELIQGAVQRQFPRRRLRFGLLQVSETR
jgi:hypothetical protein